MFVSTFQGLAAADLMRPVTGGEMGFPFDVPHLTFYRARNAIYYLFRALRASNPGLTVLVPDYNSGNEILALEAAGATLIYYPVGVDGLADPAEIDRLCSTYRPDVLYVIHYLGWPQPMAALSEICERRGLWLVEDCALSLLSNAGDRPLGSFGHWSIFCLYKTLPLPNGACLVQNSAALQSLGDIRLRRAGMPSVAGRTADLLVRHLRTRLDRLGAAAQSIKRAFGRAAGAMDVPRATVGDLGFNLEDVDLAMSDISARLLKRLDLPTIRARRIRNYERLSRQLGGRITRLYDELGEGVCPLFLPILVRDKKSVAESLRARGVDALEFWNHGANATNERASTNTTFLRQHVLGLPIHQDLSDRHIDYVAEQVAALEPRVA